MDITVVGVMAALGSAASWALGSILFRRLGDHLPPVALTFAKGITSVVLLGVAVAIIGFEAIGINAWLLLILSGLLGIALGDTLFFLALNNLGAHAVVILFTLGQVLTVILAVFWLGEQPQPLDWAGISLILGGVTIVMWTRISSEQGRTGIVGAIYGLLSVIAMAVSIIIAKEALATTGSIQATFIRMAAGTIGIFVFGQATGQILSGLGTLRQPRFFGFFLLSVAVVTFGGFWLSLVAVANLDVAIANTLNATEPLFVLPLAALLLKGVGPRYARPAHLCRPWADQNLPHRSR
jgi:drug/metabolite transporter (DMT)-like permease